MSPYFLSMCIASSSLKNPFADEGYHVQDISTADPPLRHLDLLRDLTCAGDEALDPSHLNYALLLPDSLDLP